MPEADKQQLTKEWLELAQIKEDQWLIWSLVEWRLKEGITRLDVARQLGWGIEEVAKFEKPGFDPTLSQIRRYAWAVGFRYSHSVVQPEQQQTEGGTDGPVEQTGGTGRCARRQF